MLAWTGGIIAGLLVLIVVGVYVLLHSARMHAYLLRAAQTKATSALGSDVRFRDYSVTWSGISPTFELYDISVSGTPPFSASPLLRAGTLRVGVTISSLLYRTWYVNDVEVQRPIVRVFADSNGQTNLPRPSSNQPSSGSFDIFQLGVRHVAVQQGEIYYNDEKSDLTADLRDLMVQIGFSPHERKYSGTLSYRDGHFKLDGNAPVGHQLDARFSLTPQRFDLENVHLASGHSEAMLQATVENYSQPKVHASYQAAVDAGEFRKVLRNSSVPSGLIGLSGTIEYQDDPNRPFIATADIRGEAHSRSLVTSQQSRVLRLSDLAANYSLNQGDARVTGIHARILGGELNGDLTIKDIASAQTARLRASLKNVSARAVQEFAAPTSRANVLLSGSLGGSAEASWRKSMADLVASGQLQIAAAAQPANQQRNVPLNGMIRARYSASSQALAIMPPSYIRTARTSLSLNGTVGNRSSLEVNLQAGELNEIEQIANAFRESNSPPLNLHGQGAVVATISGSMQDPQVQGQVSGSNLQVRNTTWKSLHTHFSASPDSAALEQGELIPGGQGAITFQLNTALQHWAFSPSSSFQAKLHAVNLDAKQLGQIVGSTTPVSGALSVDFQADGTELAPRGSGTIQLSKAAVGGETINHLKTEFQADGQTISARAALALPAGSVNVDVRYAPKTQAYDLNVQSSGIKLQDLDTVKTRDLHLNGTLTINASGRGSLNDPALQATLAIPRLAVRNQNVDNIALTTAVANHVAKFSLDSEAAGIHAMSQGTIQLRGDYLAEISANTQPLQLQPLLAMYAPAQATDLSGQTEFHATLRGPLKHTDQLEAHLEIPQLTLNYKDSIKLAASAPIRADYSHGTLDVKRSSIRGTGTDLTFQANLPAAADAPVSVLLQGSIDLRLAQMFSPDLTSGGRLRFDINSYGRLSDPAVQGQVKIVNASFAQAGTPLGLNNGNGTLTLTRDRLNITDFKGEVGGGTVTASGGVIYRPALRADLAMKAEGVRILYAQSVRATVNSDLALTGKSDNALLRGQVNVDQLSFTSNFDLVSFAGQFGGDTTPPPTAGISDNLHLDVAVETPGGLNLSSRDLSIAGNANLQVRGSAAEPVILGRVNLTDGDLIFYGNRYLVQRGTIDFRNPTRTDPILDMSVNTTIQQYDIQMHIWGPADHLATNYSSDPSLPPADIINLIAFGKTAEATAANPSPSGMLGAQSLVASQVSSQVTSRISKLAGISQLSVDPSLGSSQQSPGARITVQQRVTGKVFVTFSTDITATQQEVIQVEYRMNRRTSVKAVRDQNGGFSLQTNFRKDW
ncbi:MAG TPA: translocation/assembly module TamB domain-containing protein [Terriglobales bacterium]